MLIEENKALVRRFFAEVLNQQKLGVIGELFGTRPLLAAAIHETVAGYHRGLPDIEFTLEEVIAEGDAVVARWTALATHNRDEPGIRPTGRRLMLTGIYIFRLAGGQLVGLYPETDHHGLLQQVQMALGTAYQQN